MAADCRGERDAKWRLENQRPGKFFWIFEVEVEAMALQTKALWVTKGLQCLLDINILHWTERTKIASEWIGYRSNELVLGFGLDLLLKSVIFVGKTIDIMFIHYHSKPENKAIIIIRLIILTPFTFSNPDFKLLCFLLLCANYFILTCSASASVAA